ncbi:MAG: PP2C family protein-serine/threonine phosphatase [Euzebya sp.]
MSQLVGLAKQLSRLGNSDLQLDALLEQALRLSVADRGAILQRAASDALVVVRDRQSGLPERVVIRDVQASLWGVLLGRTRLLWNGSQPTPMPFDTISGWQEGLALRITAHRRPTKVLVLGGAGVTDVDMSLLQAMVDIAAPSIEGMELARATRRSHALLRGVTDLAGNLGAAVSPLQLLQAITAGLTRLDGITGACVWAGADSDQPTTEILAAAEQGAMPQHPALKARIRRLLDPDAGSSVHRLVQSAARVQADGPLVSLLMLSADPPRVLGVAHNQTLDELSLGVLINLVAAAAPALRKVEIAAERRSLLSGYARSLRPSVRPAALELAVEHHPNTTAPGSFGGDFYDWFEAGTDHAVIALGDVSGKGINAASAASMVVWSLRAIGGQGAHPTVVSHLLNGVVARELDVDRFVTLALLDVDTAAWEAQLLLAGHPPPLWCTRDGVTVVDCTPAPPLGVDAVNSAAPPVTIILEQGEALVLFTDGVTEAVGAEGERYGTERLRATCASLCEAEGWSAKGVAAGLWRTVHAWAGGPPNDDCAILVVRRPREN